MREILFRGRRKDNGEWFVGFYGKSSEKAYIIHDSHIAFGYVSMKEVNPETVGQYTGLTDKNGKKIFEGDICKFNEPFGRSGITLFVVEWDSTNARFLGFTVGGRERYIVYVGREPKVEVIGNIHDNPELLERK